MNSEIFSLMSDIDIDKYVSKKHIYEPKWLKDVIKKFKDAGYIQVRLREVPMGRVIVDPYRPEVRISMDQMNRSIDQLYRTLTGNKVYVNIDSIPDLIRILKFNGSSIRNFNLRRLLEYNPIIEIRGTGGNVRYLKLFK